MFDFVGVLLQVVAYSLKRTQSCVCPLLFGNGSREGEFIGEGAGPACL
jgi:hypothetical protein